MKSYRLLFAETVQRFPFLSLIYGSLLLLALGCKWELPVEKSLKVCQQPTGITATADATDPRRFTFALSGTTTEVSSVVWKITSSTGQLVSQVTNTTPANYTATLTTDGIYSLSATVATKCYDYLTFSTTFTVNTQLSVASSFGLTDPMVHSGLNCVAVANDGTVIANELNDIKVWNPTTRTLLRILKGHTGNVNWLTLSPDDKYLYSCGNESTIYVWDWKNGTQLPPLTGHVSGSIVYKLQITADGKYVASLGSDKTIRIWDTSTRQLARTISFSDNFNTNALAISGSNNLVAGFFYSGSTYYFIVWNYLTGAEVWRQTISNSSGFGGIAFVPGGQQLYINYYNSALNTYHLQIYDVNTKQLSKEVSLYAYNLAISPDGKYLAGGSTLYSLSDLTQLWSRYVYNYGRSLLFSNNSQFVVQGVFGMIDVYQTVSGTSIVSPPIKHPSPIVSASFAKDMRNVAVLDNPGNVKIWEVTSGQTLINTPGNGGGNSSVLNYTPDNKFLLSLGCGGSRLINATDGSQNRTISNTNCTSYDQTFIAPDGSYFVSGSGTNVLIREISTGNTLKTLPGHTSTVNGIAISPDSKTILSAGSDYTIRIWDAATGTSIGNAISTQINNGSWSMNLLSLSPDAKYLTGAAGNSLFLWDMTTRGFVRTWSNQTSYSVQTLAYSPDGKLLATGTYDGVVKIWNMPDGTLYRSAAVTYPVRKVQFTPDGKQLYVVTEKDFQVLTVK